MENKKLISLMMFFVLILCTFSFADNDIDRTKKVYNFDECDKLYVNVTATLEIEDNEYTFIECEEKKDNYWFCECSDNYDLVMNLNITTINNYTLDMEVFTKKESSKSFSSSSGGFSERGYEIFYNRLKDRENETNIINSNDNETNIINSNDNETNITNNESNDDKNEDYDNENKEKQEFDDEQSSDKQDQESIKKDKDIIKKRQKSLDNDTSYETTTKNNDNIKKVLWILIIICSVSVMFVIYKLVSSSKKINGGKNGE